MEALQTVTQAADAWLVFFTDAASTQIYTSPTGGWTTSFGNLLQRVIYHYWYHTGENLAIRQQLGHSNLPEFVGNIDSQAPYQPE